MDNGELLSFAALWTRTRVGDELIESATMLITKANAIAARVLNRMPVILPGPAEEELWPNADFDQVLELRRRLDPDGMDLAPANPALNKVGDTREGPELPVSPA